MSKSPHDYDEFVVTPKTKVSASIKIIVSMFISFASLAVLGSGEWYSAKLEHERDMAALRADLQDMRVQIHETHGDCLTRTQAQHWIDNAAEKNRVANPSIIWPPIPDE